MPGQAITLPLGRLEIEVLEYLWKQGPADVKSVHAALGEVRQRSLNTVQSTLDRLYRKNILQREKVSRAFIYSSAVEREALLLDTMGQIADQLGARDTDALMASFVQLAERDNPDNLDRLQQLIDCRRRQRSQDSGQSDE